MQRHNTTRTGSQHIADADLLPALPGAESRQSKYSQTGYENSDTRGIPYNRCQAVIRLIMSLELIIQESILKGLIGIQLMPYLPDRTKRGRHLCSIDMQDYIIVNRTVVNDEHQLIHLLIPILNIKIFYHPDDPEPAILPVIM